MSSILYERIGRGYSQVRRPDARIFEVVQAALGNAQSVVNVGAGAGSYEPADRRVVGVEPSAEMRSQRSRSAAPCLAGSAEHLPLRSGSFDAAMAIYTDFHWQGRRQGVTEMRRVSRERIVLLTVDQDISARYWLFRDYFPTDNELFRPLEELTSFFPHKAERADNSDST